jgi:hypothetical protein
MLALFSLAWGILESDLCIDMANISTHIAMRSIMWAGSTCNA